MDPYLHWRLAIDRVQKDLIAAAPLPALDGSDLLELIETDTKAGTGEASRALLNRVVAHTREHGFSLPLVQAIESWHRSFHGSAAALDLRHHIGWLLWVEDVAPICEKDCWSQRIRRDLRTLPPQQRAAWKAVVENTSFVMSRKPSKAWERAAKTALAGVPAAEFRERLRAWFGPFRAGDPMHLTINGRDVLRNLMWYVPLARDPGVDEAASWYAGAQWRNKRDRSCAESLLPAFANAMLERSDELAYGAFETLQEKGKVQLRSKTLQLYQELCARLGRKPSVEPPAVPASRGPVDLMPLILRRFADPERVRMQNGRLLVTGVHETYEIDIRESRIVRCSDRCPIRLEIDFSQPGFAMMRPMLDGLDMDDPFRPNYFRLMVCIRILLHDDINAATIVAETL